MLIILKFLPVAAVFQINLFIKSSCHFFKKKNKNKKSQPRISTHYTVFSLTYLVNENRCQSNELLNMQIFISWKALEADKEVVDNGFHWYVTKGWLQRVGERQHNALAVNRSGHSCERLEVHHLFHLVIYLTIYYLFSHWQDSDLIQTHYI